MIPLDIRVAAEIELRRRYADARGTFLGFVQRVRPSLSLNWFHRILARKLDKFLDDVMAKRHPRLMIIAPPRHGKSEMVSRLFPAYAFGRFPRTQCIACSYAFDLAQRMNRDVQRVIEEPIYTRIFPATRLNSKNIATLSGQPLRNSNIFEIPVIGSAPGAYRSAGVGQGITGMGFDIGLIDDPVKDEEEASSEVKREGTWEWYQSTFYTRRSPVSGILLVMTRWHEADLGGKLLHAAQFEGGDQWEVIRFPAIAEEDEFDEDGTPLRKAGEALHEERFPLSVLEQTRRVQGSYHFAALYQGRPVPKGGGIVKPEQFKFYRKSELEALLSAKIFDMIVFTTDAAFKDSDTSSFVVTQVWGKRGVDSFLLAQSRKRTSFLGTISEILRLRQSFPNVAATLIEDKANGPAIIEVMKTKIPGVIAVEPLGSKEARAEAAAPLIEAGNIWLPHPDEEPWVELFIHEWCSVPTGAFWDQVDASAQYMIKYGRQTPIIVSDHAAVGKADMQNDRNAPWNQGRGAITELPDDVLEGFIN